MLSRANPFWVLIYCLLVFILHLLSSNLLRSISGGLSPSKRPWPQWELQNQTSMKRKSLWSDSKTFSRVSVSGYDAAFLRGVPSHEDLSGQNVFINREGLITGIIDWEFHMIKPAVLAAAYPSWIRYDGTADPRFVDRKGQFPSFWMASPVDAEKLRQEYDVVCVNT